MKGRRHATGREGKGTQSELPRQPPGRATGAPPISKLSSRNTYPPFPFAVDQGDRLALNSPTITGFVDTSAEQFPRCPVLWPQGSHLGREGRSVYAPGRTWQFRLLRTAPSTELGGRVL